MELKYTREEVKYQLEKLDLTEQECVTMIEVFVKHKLPDTAQEVFYTEMMNKEVTVEHVKNALYHAVLSNVSETILKFGIEQYENNQEKFKEDMEKWLQIQNQ